MPTTYIRLLHFKILVIKKHSTFVILPVPYENDSIHELYSWVLWSLFYLTLRMQNQVCCLRAIYFSVLKDTFVETIYIHVASYMSSKLVVHYSKLIRKKSDTFNSQCSWSWQLIQLTEYWCNWRESISK